MAGVGCVSGDWVLGYNHSTLHPGDVPVDLPQDDGGTQSPSWSGDACLCSCT